MNWFKGLLILALLLSGCSDPAKSECSPTSTPPSKACTVPNGRGTAVKACVDGAWSDWTCAVSACDSGFELTGNTCVAASGCSGASSQTCAIDNGSGEQERSCSAGAWSAWSECVPSACNQGYLSDGHQCLVASCDGAPTQPCAVDHGNGQQTRTCSAGVWSDWGACAASSCISGYVVVQGQCVEEEAPTCAEGAVSSACTCGASVVSSGYCCAGTPQGTACACTSGCSRVRLDGGLASGTSTFDGKVFSPLLAYLTSGGALDSDEGIRGNYPIAQTDFDALYQNETWINTSPATFTIPVEDGDYTVHLHFVDWANSAAGERVFHVDVQGARRLTDFDIVAEAGPSTALVESFDVAATGGAVTVTFTNVSGVQAEIAAIEILPVGEPHLATTAAASCGPSDGVCPASCTRAQDPDCPAPVCAEGAVASTCACGSSVVSSGSCCAGAPQAGACPAPACSNGPVTGTCTCGPAEVSSGYCCAGTPQSSACTLGPAFYVSPGGSDGNAGTSALEPFQTLEKARDAARASNTKTIYLLGGVYDRTATLELGGADAGESWLGYPGQTPILEGGSSTENAIVVNGDDITIRWITFQNFVTNTLFVGWGDARRVVIDSNTILNTISDGWVQGAIYMCCGQHTEVQITHNLVDGANYIGIHAGASASSNGDITGVTIAHNQVHDTCRTVADCGAIYVWDIQHVATDITIDGNVVKDYASPSSLERAIYLDDETSNVTVRNNIVSGYGQWAFQIHGGDHNTFTNNIFDISDAVKLGLYQDDGDISPNYGMAANVVSCNIVYSSAAPPSTLWDKFGSLPVALPDVSDNLYWGAAGALPNTGDIVDSNPTVANPGFVDPAAGDYRFSGANPAAFCGFQPIDASQVGPLPNP